MFHNKIYILTFFMPSLLIKQAALLTIDNKLFHILKLYFFLGIYISFSHQDFFILIQFSDNELEI